MTAPGPINAIQAALLAQAAAQPPVPPSGVTSTAQFFDDYLAQLFKRDLSAHTPTNWCLQWEKHDEAVEVVKALWHSWEVLRLDQEMGMAVWMRDFAYPLLGRLFTGEGTFANCNMQMKEGHDPERVTALNQPLD